MFLREFINERRKQMGDKSIRKDDKKKKKQKKEVSVSKPTTTTIKADK